MPIRSAAARLLLLLVLPLLLGAPTAAATAQEGRVVVLGFDGADARTVAQLMAAGQLPNLKALADEGTFGPLLTTNPAESPVSWSSLNTGQNPAKTGIPGFVVRDLVGGTPLPGIGFYESASSVPLERFAGKTPIPIWDGWMLALVAGLLVLVVFLVVFKLLLRVRAAPTVILSIVLAAGAGWAARFLRSYLPAGLPVVQNTLQATPFWEVAASAGVPSVVLDAAQAWDREHVPGTKVLAGLGVPDARGQYNGFTIYTSDELWFAYEPTRESETPSAGNKLRVDWKDGRIEAEVYGPRNFWLADAARSELEEVKARLADVKTPFKQLVALGEREKALEAELKRIDAEPLSLPLELVRREGGARVAIDGQEQDLDVGSWSDWYRLTFELNPLLKVHALTRAKIVRLEPHLTLYVDTLQIDPARPPFWQPISQPDDFAGELAHAVGPYETVGWACMTLPYKDGEVDPVSFMQDIEFTFEWRERMTLERLRRGDWRLLMSCLSTPDRVQHMMYQFYDPDHPLYDEAAASSTMTFFDQEIELRDAIPAIYRQVDELIGAVRAELRPEDVLVLCADHGFQSFRRQVHLNNWLFEKGYLAVVPQLSRGRSKLVTSYVDWSRTKAYSIGLGMVYLNLEGRESKGIVAPEEVDELLAAISKDFLETVDPATGQRIGRVAHVTSDIHEGPYLDLEADLMLGFEAGYRVSWDTTGGGLDVLREESGAWVPGPSIVDNDKNWSGDHVSVDPTLVQGIFFCNRRLAVPSTGLDLRHVAPTVLTFLGVDVPAECDLPPLSPLD